MPSSAAYKGNLVFWRDLNSSAIPLHAPSPTSPHILIIGGGVTGLTTAWTLLDHGYRVTILSKERASYGASQRLTSQIAGALWEFPPAVCGQHTDAISLQHSKHWCMVAYHIWAAIAADEKLAKAAGVRMKNANFFFPVPVEEDEAQASKMREIMQSGVRGFRRSAAIITEQRVSPAFGAVDAYSLLAPIIDTDACMSFLKTLVSAKGATLITRTITGDLFHQEHALRAAFAADAILNCTGLASTDLANDPSCYPIRGALLRVLNNGTAFPKLDHALTCSPDPVRNRSDIVFLVPRNDDVLLIGGIVEPHETSLDLTLDSPVIGRMRARCEAFLPDLKHAELDEEYPLAQGLRPFRQRNIRVERELRVHDTDAKGRSGVSRIVHSYGHGGAGWSLCFGCAGDVLALVEEALADMPARTMGVDVVAVWAGEPDSFKDPARARL